MAVDSFTQAFGRLGLTQALSYPHFVGTLDSFIAKYIFMPFGHCLMNCSKSPILIEGNEHFLIQTSQDRNGQTKRFAAYGINHGIRGEPRPCITKFEIIRENDNFIGLPTQENKTEIKANVAAACRQKAVEVVATFGKKDSILTLMPNIGQLGFLKNIPKLLRLYPIDFRKLLLMKPKTLEIFKNAF